MWYGRFSSLWDQSVGQLFSQFDDFEHNLN